VTKQRLSATVDAELVDAAMRAVAAGRAASVSAWVNEALRRQAEHDARLTAADELFEAWEAEHGKITEEDMRAAEKWLEDGTIWVEPAKPPKRRKARA
jgi:Arc/MetJ-type ribon-helix-helix transcriptional regulator